MNLTEINPKLKNLYTLPVVEESPSSDFDGGESYTIRKISDELFIKVYFYKDSYGSNETTGFEFVKPVEKTVTNFEII